jgi:hypothetical protein
LFCPGIDFATMEPGPLRSSALPSIVSAERGIGCAYEIAVDRRGGGDDIAAFDRLGLPGAQKEEQRYDDGQSEHPPAGSARQFSTLIVPSRDGCPAICGHRGLERLGRIAAERSS